MRKLLVAIVAIAVTGFGAAATAQYVRQPNPVQYYVPPPVAPRVQPIRGNQGNYRAPFTQYRGRTYVPRSYYDGSGLGIGNGFGRRQVNQQQHHFIRRSMMARTYQGPVARPTGQPYSAARVAVVENGISYTDKSCVRRDGSSGREGFSGGQLGCWRF